MADGIHVPVLDQPIRQQMQRPALLSAGRRTANSGDEKGFGRTIEHAGFALGLLAVKHRCFPSFLSEATPHLPDGGVADLDLLADGRIQQSPILAMGVSKQQDLSALSLAL